MNEKFFQQLTFKRFPHKKIPLVIYSTRDTKNAHRKNGLVLSVWPIFQALAPYLPAGCCVVNGLVPRTLFMVDYILINF